MGKWSITMSYDTVQRFLRECTNVADWRGKKMRNVIINAEGMRVVMADARMMSSTHFETTFFSGEGDAFVMSDDLKILHIELDFTRLNAILTTIAPDERATLSITPPEGEVLIELKRFPKVHTPTHPSTSICSIQFQNHPGSQAFEVPAGNPDAVGTIYNFPSFVRRALLFGKELDVTCKNGKIATFARGAEAAVLSTVETDVGSAEVDSQRYGLDMFSVLQPLGKADVEKDGQKLEALPVTLQLSHTSPARLCFGCTTCIIAPTKVAPEHRTRWSSPEEALASLASSR